MVALYNSVFVAALLLPVSTLGQAVTLSDATVNLNEVIPAIDTNGNNRIDTETEIAALAKYVNTRLVRIAPQTPEETRRVTGVELLTNFKEDNTTGKDTEDFSLAIGYRFKAIDFPAGLEADTEISATFKYGEEQVRLGTEREFSRSLSFLPVRVKGPINRRVYWDLQLGLATKKTLVEDATIGMADTTHVRELVTILGLEFKLHPQWSLVLADDLRFRGGSKSSDSLQVGFKFVPDE